MPKMIYLPSAVLLLFLSFAAGLSLENLSGRQNSPPGKAYSTDRLLHELKDQMQNGRGAGVNLAEAQLSSKKKKSSNDLQEYMPKTDTKDDSYDPGINSFYGSEGSLGPAWDPLYSYSDLQNFRDDVKRNKRARKEEQVGNSQELADILKDDDGDKKPIQRERKVPPDVKRQEGHHGKKKRQSDDSSTQNAKDTKKDEDQDQGPDFQEWLRREYYRNMARSFASMRRKRAGWGPLEGHTNDSRSPPATNHRKIAKQGKVQDVQKRNDHFKEVTDHLKNIEDALLTDALRIMNENEEGYADDAAKRKRITNDLNAAYDLETMRTALFHLKDTLSNIEDDDDDDSEGEEYPIYANYRKRDDQCPPLDLLASDCSVLSDIVTEGPLKQLLLNACNWHEVCYTCGEAFGLTSDNCDVGFVEQSHTICRGDVPCQTTAGLLLLPLRQRRVFYKRSNPSVCFVDPCVEEFLKQG